MYTAFANAIQSGDSRQPTFDTAVGLHRLIDCIRQSSTDGRTVTFAE
jgi:predicted dehydrogenase